MFPQYTENDFKNLGIENGEPIFQIDVVGKNPNQLSSISALNISIRDADNKIRGFGKRNESIAPSLVNLLNLDSANPNSVSSTEINDKVAIAFKNLKNDLREDYITRLESGEDLSQLIELAGIPPEEGTSNIEIADNLANYDMGSITSIAQLLKGIINMQNQKEQSVEISETNLVSAIEKYIIPPLPGEEYTFEQFVVESIQGVNIDDEEAIVEALAKENLALTKEDTDAFSVLLNESRNIINKIK